MAGLPASVGLASCGARTLRTGPPPRPDRPCRFYRLFFLPVAYRSVLLRHHSGEEIARMRGAAARGPFLGETAPQTAPRASSFCPSSRYPSSAPLLLGSESSPAVFSCRKEGRQAEACNLKPALRFRCSRSARCDPWSTRNSPSPATRNGPPTRSIARTVGSNRFSAVAEWGCVQLPQRCCERQWCQFAPSGDRDKLGNGGGVERRRGIISKNKSITALIMSALTVG
jgi:hypothetical protein